MNKLLRASLVATLCGLLSSQVLAAGDAVAGKAKSQSCVACHGEGGRSTVPAFPILAGQHADYLAQALKDYRSGKRTNPVMAPQAQNLSAKDVADIAAYFSSQSGGVFFRGH